MRFIRKIYYFFTPYTGPDEKAVAKFFKHLSEHSKKEKVSRKLNNLLQKDIATINLWSEYRYKGYSYLRKSERRKLYNNLSLIELHFAAFYRENGAKNTPQSQQSLLKALMAYFHQVYEYRASSSFGRLLRDPTKEKLIGDCNQIVTLYIYLFSRYYPVSDLKIRVLPGHVALHYNGKDIEATSGTFADYSDSDGSHLLSLEEIVSINLLDTSDAFLQTHEINPEDLLQASRFAYILSHEHSITAHNLGVAYGNLVNVLMNKHNYQKALKIAKASRDATLIAVVGHNGTLDAIKNHQFASARKFASYATNASSLIKECYRSEGAYLYKNKHYNEALVAFKKYGDNTLVRQCYEALYISEQKKLDTQITQDTARKQAKVIKKMRFFAKKSGNRTLIEQSDKLSRLL